MPKISKTRIINLKYNDNKRTIANQTFDFQGGKNVLFSMDNGVGKTVLIQFFMQPFLSSNKYRKLAGRPFEDYFVDNSPTFIMHEMLLDNAEKLLIGLIVRKETSLDNDDKLRIHAFTNKYTYLDDFDIDHIPFVKDKTIIKYSDAITLIKEYSREHHNFAYYNFADYARKKSYFDCLSDNNIDCNQWEKIIRNINNDESGLSNLYDQYKTDESLIKGVIIPLIEDKLKDGDNKIELLKTNLDKYITSYKTSASQIKEVEVYDRFLIDINDVTSILDSGEILLLEKNKSFNLLNYIANDLASKLETSELSQTNLQTKIDEINTQIKFINYEKDSKKYHDIYDSITELSNDISLKENNQVNYTNNISKFNTVKYNMKLALENQYLNKVVIKLNQVIERINSYTNSDSENAINIRNYKYNLNIFLDEFIKETELDIKNTTEKFDELEKQIKDDNIKLKSLDEKINKENQNKGSTSAKIHNFNQIKTNFIKKYPAFNYSMNLLKEYVQDDLDNFSNQINQKLNDVALMIKDNLTDIETEKNKGIELLENKKENNDSIIENNNKLATYKQELVVFDEASSRIKEILIKLGISDDIYENKDRASVMLNSNIIKLENSIKTNETKININLEKIQFYQTGIKLPIEIINALDELSINYEYGLSFLQNYKGKSYEIKQILNDNPFFPFSLILEDSDIKKLETEKLDILTSILIPIINRNELNKNIKYVRNKDVLTIVNQKFLSAFNPMLVNKQELKNIIESLTDSITKIEEENEKTKIYLETNRDDFACLNNYTYLGNEHLELEKNINLTTSTINTLTEESTKLDDKIKDNNKLVIDLNENKSKLEILLNNTKILSQDYQNFIENYQSYVEEKGNLVKIEEKIQKYLLDKSDLIESIKKLNDDQTEINGLLVDKNGQLSDFRKERSSNGDIDNAEKLDLSYLELKGKLNALEEQLKQDIKRDEQEKSSLIDEQEKYQLSISNLKKEGDILDDEYLKLDFKQQTLDDALDKIKENTKLFNEITKEITSLKVSKGTKENNLIIRLEKINENGFDEPLEKKFIKGDFDGRIKTLKSLYKEYNDQLLRINKTIKNLEKVSYQLIDYKLEGIIDESITFNYRDELELLESVKKTKDNYNNIIENIKIHENKIKNIIDDLVNKYKDITVIHGSLNKYRYKDDKLSNKIDIVSLVEVVNRKLATIRLSLQSLNQEEESVINEIVRYTNACLDELKSVDKNSSIKIYDKTQKLLNIDIPELTEEETLKEYLREIIKYSSNQDDYKDYLNDSLTTYYLLDKYVGSLSRVKVYIYKIEATHTVKKTWQQTLSQNSGGEKFVSMFMLLSSFMSYVRRSNVYIGKNELSKVIIMDNPFAKTNAQHLLVPLFKIAENYKTQIIALSGIGGSPVYNRFDVIYVSKVITNKYTNNESVAFVNKQEGESLEYSEFNYKRTLID